MEPGHQIPDGSSNHYTEKPWNFEIVQSWKTEIKEDLRIKKGEVREA